MRCAHTGPIRTTKLALMAALVLALVLTSAVSAMPAEPEAPAAPDVAGHFFYGTVMTDRGILLPGVLVSAKTVTGSWKGTVSATSDTQSRYGYNPVFYIPEKFPGDGAVKGDDIAFFVLGTQALLYDVKAAQTYTTYNFDPITGPTELNLIIHLDYTISATTGPGGTISPAGNVTVDYGLDQKFTFTPGPNQMILDVLVDGVSNPGAVAAGSYTFTNVKSNHSIHVVFVQATYVITPIIGTGCTITPDDPQTVNYMGSQTFAVGAQTGYNLVDVKIDNVSNPGALAAHGYTFTNVTANHTIEAVCARQPFQITGSAGAGGSISPSLPQTVYYGDNITFTITPAAGYVIEDVKVDGVSNPAAVASGSYTFTNVQAGHTIAATFTPQEFTITPAAGPNGSISPNTPQTVLGGASKTFTFTPDLGYEVEDVKVDGALLGPLPSFTFINIVANHTIEVTFKQADFTITPSVKGVGGTINPSNPMVVMFGDSQTFDFTPDPGYNIVDVKVDGVSQGPITTYTFDDVQADHTIEVTFERPLFRYYLPRITK